MFLSVGAGRQEPVGRLRGECVSAALAAWNVVIQSDFDPFTRGTNAAIWTGESGVLTAAAVWILFLVITRARWAGTVATT